MDKIIIFVIISMIIVVVSRKTLFNFHSHGFYRFLSWECIAWLISSGYKGWFTNPFSAKQIFSWFLLLISAYLVITGVIFMKKLGRRDKNRNENNLYKFEKTSELVDKGVYKRIRHPLYSSLFF
ncbi:MAG: hypothetical protein ACYC2P_12470 [Paludibacteraceae bacterium]